MPAVDKVKSITLFVVVNSDGQFFRRKGYGGSGGSGKTWVDDAATARCRDVLSGLCQRLRHHSLHIAPYQNRHKGIQSWPVLNI